MENYSILDEETNKQIIDGFTKAFQKRKVDVSPDERDRPFRPRLPSLETVHVTKNDVMAQHFLEQASQEPRFRERVIKLSRCLAYAATTEMKAEAYTRRAGILYAMDEEHLALLDTNRAYALERGEFLLPKTTKSRLDQVRRGARSNLVKKKDYRKIAVEYQTNNSKWVSAEARRCSRGIRIPNNSQVDDIVLEEDPHEMWTQVPPREGRRLSDKVRLTYKDKYGWHWKAWRDISAGEPLSVEDFFALKLSSHNVYFYCSYCTIWCLAPIPCNGCATEMYCSERCLWEAFHLYHKTECKVLPYLSNLQEREVSLLALRIFLTGTNQGWNLIKGQWGGPEPLNSDREVYLGMCARETRHQRTFKNDYHTVLTMQWLRPDWKTVPFMGLLPHFVLSDMIEVIVALRRIDFADTEPADNVYSDNFSALEKLTIVLLLQNTALLTFNRSNLYATFFKGLNRPATKIIGVGVPTCHSFLNHSCDPPAAVIRDRRRELVYAVRDIKTGEEITIAYGDVGEYGSKPLRERRPLLRKKYKILDCRCRACEKKEGIKDPEVVHNSYIKALYTAEIEDKVFEFQELLERFEKYPGSMDEDNLKTLFEFQTGESRKALVELRSQTVWTCEYLIKKWMQILRGNFRRLRRVHSEP